MTHEEFIAKAEAAHGARYDYSSAAYAGCDTKVSIICSIHGVFMQAPRRHIAGSGCFKCSREAQGLQKRKPRGHYIGLFNAKHEGKYDYSLLPEMFKAKDIITIKCPIHGQFMQVADKHKEHGCSKCTKAIGPIKAISSNDFLNSARKVHGAQYAYKLLPSSINRTQKILINCPLHGNFEQFCYYHLAGGGCAGCGWIDRGGNRKATLYFLRIFSQDEEFFKVGITHDSVEVRYKSGKSLKGYQYEILALSSSHNASAIWNWEQSILQTFSYLKYRPKTRFAGETECFSSCEEILAIFPL